MPEAAPYAAFRILTLFAVQVVGNTASPDWRFIDGNCSGAIRKDSSKVASNPRLVSINSKLYVTWQESNGTASQIRVAVYAPK